MVEVFKGLNNKKKSYYAVTGTRDVSEAIREVAKYTKESYSKLSVTAGWAYGRIAPYENGMNGLWLAKDYGQGKPCIFVWK